MVTLERNNSYQGIIFDDGVQQFIQGMRWEDDYEHEDLADDFREYFNRHFSKISEPITVKRGVTVIRTHCSVDKFPEKYANTSPLGLLGFGMSTIFLSFCNVNLYHMNTMII